MSITAVTPEIFEPPKGDVLRWFAPAVSEIVLQMVAAHSETVAAPIEKKSQAAKLFTRRLHCTPTHPPPSNLAVVPKCVTSSRQCRIHLEQFALFHHCLQHFSASSKSFCLINTSTWGLPKTVP